MHITLQGHAFSIPDAYSEGHRLTALEAQILNMARGDNIRANCQAWAKEALGKFSPGEELPPAVREQVQERLSRYAEGYFFRLPIPKGAKPSTYELELRRLAEAKVYGELGRVEGMDGQIAAAMEDPEVQEQARQGAEKLKKLAQSSLKDLL